jgi:hypothetical protein
MGRDSHHIERHSTSKFCCNKHRVSALRRSPGRRDRGYQGDVTRGTGTPDSNYHNPTTLASEPEFFVRRS